MRAGIPVEVQSSFGLHSLGASVPRRKFACGKQYLFVELTPAYVKPLALGFRLPSYHGVVVCTKATINDLISEPPQVFIGDLPQQGFAE